MSRKSSKPATNPVVETPAEPVVETKKSKWEALDADRLAWVTENARPAVSTCLCGCGGTTKGRFVPGHDATLKEALKATPGGDAALATFGW